MPNSDQSDQLIQRLFCLKNAILDQPELRAQLTLNPRSLIPMLMTYGLAPQIWYLCF